jgi:hypothetical protein
LPRRGCAALLSARELAELSAAIEAHLDEYESHERRGEPSRFVQKRPEINPGHLAVVVFAQDAAT